MRACGEIAAADAREHPAPQVGEFKMGPVAPFDAAIVCLSVGAVVISLTWTENYGQRSKAAVRNCIAPPRAWRSKPPTV